MLLAFTALVGSNLLTHWSSVDRISAWILLLIYYCGHRFFTRLGECALETHVWRFLGRILTFLVVQDGIYRLESVLQKRDASFTHAITGLLLCFCGLPLVRYQLFPSSHILHTVVYTVALYFTSHLLRLVTRTGKPLLNPPALVGLTISLCWLHCRRRLAARLETLSTPILLGFVTQVSVFFLTSWLVYAFNLRVASFDTDPVTSACTIIFFMFAMVLIGRVYIIDKDTLRSLLETFATFLSQSLVYRYSPSRHPLGGFIVFALVLWYFLRSARDILKLKLSKREWDADPRSAISIIYIFDFAIRMSSYITVQALFPHLALYTRYTLTFSEYTGLYALLIVFASYFLWNDSCTELSDKVKN
jgi:hypothetical protein